MEQCICLRIVQSGEHHKRFVCRGRKILEELYERLTRDKRDEEVQNVMAFWGKLREYQRSCLQSSEDQAMTAARPSDLLERFKWDVLWHELYPTQEQSKNWRSTADTILHKKCAWKHAAQAIMLYGLPTLEHHERPDDATEHINALGQFARDMSKWLVNFASSMHAYRQTDEYQKNYETSMTALRKRTRRDSEDSR